MKMNQGVSSEQIARAKALQIDDYVRTQEPDNITRVGGAYYLKDHDSLVVRNGMWHWHSRGIGGKNVVDYLMKVRGYSFVDAVRQLAGDGFTIQPPYALAPMARPPTTAQAPMHTKESVKSAFKLPRRNADNDRVLAYLERRGIDRKMAQDCIDTGLLYESAAWHNAVFVGRDESGKARYATVRGTTDVTAGSSRGAENAETDAKSTVPFRRDVEGSDKSCGWFLPPTSPDCTTVLVFESPIDAMSHKLLCPEVDGFRLSLGGTALSALTRFLENHSEINTIITCTDNDTAGHLAARKIAALSGRRVIRALPPAGKDWNDALQIILTESLPLKQNEPFHTTQDEVKPLTDARKDILFLKEPFKYPEAFRIKDGDSIKATYAYDGEVAILKCRFIDETHLTIGSYSYHISELAGKLNKNGDRVEPIPNQKPMLNILAAAYGEPLRDVEIPMTEAAIRRLVGGAYTTEALRGDHVLLRGKTGAAVCKQESGALTSVHPYWAQTLIKEVGIAEPSVTPSVELPAVSPPAKPDMLGKLDKFKEKSAAQTSVTQAASPDKRRDTAVL